MFLSSKNTKNIKRQDQINKIKENPEKHLHHVISKLQVNNLNFNQILGR